MYDLQKLSFGVCGAFLVLLGVTLPYYWNDLVTFLVRRELVLTPTSRSYDLWKGTPVPISMDFYFWNWTNPDELKNNTRPAFTEMGPYSFKEVHEKVNVSWNDNGTVTFQMVRKWYFDEENSKGSLDDQVTTLNAVALTAARTVRDWSFFFKTSLSVGLTTTGQNISITKRVRQLLFEGYTDKLIEIALRMPQFAEVDVPFDRFGWFYMMNDSTLMDGVFTMNTGENDITNIGNAELWNYQNTTRYFRGACADVRGSAGEFFPPGVKKGGILSMFSANLCRSIKFEYADEHVVKGMTGYRFVGGKDMIDNGTLAPDNECFCSGECLPSGVINVTACRYGAPGFASFPHFHLADPSYREAIEGMHPDPNIHTFYLTLEPTTGIPLDVKARLQINLLLRPIDGIGLFSGVPEVMFPMIWFEQRATITEDLAFELRAMLFALTADLYVAFLLVVSGFLLLCYVVITAFSDKRENNALNLVNSLDELASLKTGKITAQIKS